MAAPTLLEASPLMPYLWSFPSLSALAAALFVGAGAGALSIAHCAAMCGPLAVFGCSGGEAGEPSRGRAALWLVGRTTAYAVLGSVVGGATGAIAHLLSAGPFESVISIVLGLALLTSGVTLLRPRPASVTLGRGPRRSGLVSAAMHRVLGLRSAPFFMGALSGALPCGALWAALASASATGSALTGALAMVTFSLVSAPGLVLAGALSDARFDGTGRRLVGAALLLGALVLLVRPWTVSSTGDACHAPHASSRSLESASLTRNPAIATRAAVASPR